ncbi:telomere repeats-binding bouquet formation protein 2 isoform X2 [Centropristis striata]|uniref:telomere repeats-binding bouquet formation protein 2 isoform X2 n=1 Tax=Centropristis striata TaxID=184440 RepID=UPI0027DFF740|nr:telomere repeats-binding bouquet formation protein 2 isoform X2 [Centropristis striata]
MAVLEGGSIADWRTADYLFSADAKCPDTLRIFESKDYLWNKVVVFHSLFLSVCENRQSVKSVRIGHYVLPPASVQDEVRHVVGRLIWECEEERSVAEDFNESFSFQTEDGYTEKSKSSSETSDTNSQSEDSSCAHNPSDNMLTGCVSMDSLQKYSGDLFDLPPECCRK